MNWNFTLPKLGSDVCVWLWFTHWGHCKGFQLSNEKWAPGCLGYIGDEILPSYIGIIFHKPWHKDPVFHQPGWLMERIGCFFFLTVAKKLTFSDDRRRLIGVFSDTKKGENQKNHSPKPTKTHKVHPRKLTWIPNMMVWKRWLLLNMAIFGIYVSFPGCNYFVVQCFLVSAARFCIFWAGFRCNTALIILWSLRAQWL